MVKTVLGVAAVAFFALTLAAWAGTVYQLSDNQPPDYPTTIGDRKFADQVKERNGGMFVIVV
jgi:TRAP-type C4-dicarboxylate transport system substrate-binding protein